MTSIIFNTLKENRKRILSWVCVLSMFLNTLPVSSFASEAGEIVPDPVEVVQEAVQEEPESVVPAVLPAEEQATVPASNEEEANVPVADVQDEEQDAPAAVPEPVLDNNADITPVVGDIEPDASDIVPEGQDAASASEEVNLPSLFIDFPATGVFSGDSLSVSYKYTSAKDEELVISLDNIATEIEVKYLSDEMPVETVRTEDEETGYAYYRLSALKDEVYFIRIFVDKAEEEIPYSVTITEYKEPASDVEPEVENIDPDNAGDALIDIPPEAAIDEPEASNDTEPDAGMVDIFPDLPDNNDTSAFDNFLNDNTEPAEETPAEENDGDEQEPAEDIVPVEPTNEEIPDENTDPVDPEGQVSEDLEETVGEEPAVEEPDVEPQDNNSEEDDDNDAQDAENPASDADLPDIIPDADNSASDAFDGFLVDDENNEEEPAEDNTAEEAPAVEAADENAAEDILDEEENPDDFLVTDDEEDSEEEPAPADETVDEPADEEAEESVPEENEQPDETTEGEEEPTEDATGEQDEVPTDKEEAESSDEDEAASDESESEDGEESSEGEEAEEPEEEETIGLDEETLTVIDGVYTYTGHGMTVTVETTEENALPEGTEFVLAPVSADEERVQDYIAQAAEKNGVDVSAIIPYVYDMHFELDGEEVHIAEGSSVKVNIVFDKALDLGDVVAAPFYHAEDGVLVELIHDVTAKEEVSPLRGNKMLKVAAPMKAAKNAVEEVPVEETADANFLKETTEENAPEEKQEESKVVESIEFTTSSFSDYMLMGVGGTRAVDKYAILYSNGDLVFQDGNTPDTSRGTVTASWLCTDGITAKEWAERNYRSSVTNVYIDTVIQFYPGNSLFSQMSEIENIYNIQNIDLSNKDSLSYAFSGCVKLQHIYGLDLWDVSTISKVSYMFNTCLLLEDINDIEGWNLTINDLTYGGGLYFAFGPCERLQSLDLSSWDLGSILDASYAFDGDTLLETVNLGNIFENATTSVYATCMFRDCSSLVTVNDIFQNNTSNNPTHNLNQTFYNCRRLTGPLDLSNIKIKTLYNFAGSCESLTEVDLSGSVYDGIADNMHYAFTGCTSLESIDFTNSTGYVYNEIEQSLATGLLERDSTGEQYGALALQRAWDDSMGDLYTYVDHVDHDHIYVIQYKNGDLVFQENDIIDETKGGVKQQWVYNAYPAEISMASNVNTWRSDQSYRLQVKNIYINTPITFQRADNAGTSSVFFSGFDNCEYIYGINNIDLSNEYNLNYAFRGDGKLKHIYGLSEWDTNTITSLVDSFKGCKLLDNINDIEGWDLNVSEAGMGGTFSDADSLISLDLSSWDLSNLDKLYETFNSADNLTSVNLGNIFTGVPNSSSTEINLYYAFRSCSKLATINGMLSNIPSNCRIRLVDFMCMSYGNGYENTVFNEHIDLSGHTIVDMPGAFRSCKALPSVDMSNCTVSADTYMTGAFAYCTSLEEIDFTGLNATASSNSLNDTFKDTTSLSYLDLSSIFFSAGNSNKNGFLEDSGITRVTLGPDFLFKNAILPVGVWERETTGETYTAAQLKEAWNSSMADTYFISDPTDYDNKYAILYSNGDLVFQESNQPDSDRGTVVEAWLCPDGVSKAEWQIQSDGKYKYRSSIKRIYFNTPIKLKPYTNNGSHFTDLNYLEYIYNIENFDTSNLTSLNSEFYQCNSLKHIYGLENWDNSTITDIQSMFSYCYELDNVSDISSWNLSISRNGLARTFTDCRNIRSLDLSSWDLSNVNSLQNTFMNAGFNSKELVSVNLGNIFTAAENTTITMAYAFDACHDLVDVGNIFANIPSSSTVNLNYAFRNCTSIEDISLNGCSVTNLSSAFNGCSSLKYADLSNCTLAGSASDAFSQCAKLRKLDLTNVNATSSSTGLSNTFGGTKTLAYLDLSSVYFNGGSKNSATFNGSGITKIKLGSGFQFNSSILPTGNWRRESTGEIYTAAQLKSAWNSSMADTYEKVNVVIFEGNGGTVYPTRLVKHLDEVFEEEDFPTATRPGYTFVGWYSDEKAGHEITAGDIIDQDIYFARWSENTYTLVLKKNDPNDANDTEIRIPLAYSDIYALSPDLFSVEGKVLQEWTTSPDGTGKVYGSDERVGMLTEINNDVVYLYAKWGRSQNVSISFDSQGGSPVDTIIAEKYTTVTPSQLVTPYKSGSTFAGWWTDPVDGERWDTSDHVMTESVQLYAHWEKDPVITFVPNGGYISKLSTSVPYGGTLSDLPWGSDNSKKLVGFFTSPTFGEGEQLTTNTVITDDATYYAQWGYQPYFNLAGGRYSSSYSLDTNYPISESSLIEITSFPNVERDGYTLNRWMLPDGTTVNIGDVIDRELVPEIIAEWNRAETVTVTFNPLYGYMSQYAESESTSLCKTYEMPKGTPLGYYPDAYYTSSSMRLEFLGWFDKDGTLYTRDTIINDDVTLYARWENNTRVMYKFVVPGTSYQATSMYNNSTSTVSGNRQTTVYRTKGEEFGVLPGLSVYSSGATLNGKYLEGWYSELDPFESDGVTLRPGVEKLLPTTAKTETSTWYANIVNNVVDKFDDQTAYKYYTEWTNASNNDVTNLNGNLDFHPQSTTNQTAQLHMHFELNSEVTETLPIGSVRITFPKSVWKDWNGNDIGTTNISAQMPMFPEIQSGMFFSYAEDGNGNYVILNNQEISGGAGVDLTIAYTVSPLQVPGGAIDRDNDYVDGYNYYAGNVPVTFEIDRDAVTSYNTVDGVPVLNDTFVADVHEDKTLTIEMHTKVEISIQKEFISVGYNWSNTWGEEPADSKDYFYITWRTSSRYNINQPFTQFITEDTVHDGTVIYNSFESQYPSGREITANSQNVYYYTIVTRHPKSLLNNIPSTGIKFRNQVRHTANWKSGYVTEYVADAEHTIYNWQYPLGEFDKSNVYGASNVSSISPFGSIGTHAPTSPRYVTYSSAQNKLLANQNLTFEWDLVYDGWSSGTPILWNDETSTYSRQQRIIALSDGNNKDIMYSSGKPSARYVWEPTTGNFPLSDYDYSVNRLRVYLREYDGEYRNGEWGGPTLRDDYSMWNEVSIYVRYRNTEDLVYFTNLKLTGSGNAATNGYAVATVTLPANVAGWEVRYPTSYFKTYLQVNEEVILHPTAEVKKYISDDVVGKYTSIIKNRGYCDIWTSDDVFAEPTGVFFHATDWTGGYNGANKEIYELTYTAGALHTNKFSSSQGNVIFDVQRGVQDNPIAMYGRNYYDGGLQPIKSGRFYDLLPRGATVDPATLYIVLTANNGYGYISTNYANNYSTNPTTLTGYLPKEYYNVEFVENWQNSGRTMMIIDYRSNNQTSNMATVYYLLRMTYQDVISYGTAVQNDVAFMDTSGTNRYNVTSSSSLKNAISVLGDDATYYEDISVMEDAVVYAVAPTNYIPVDAYSWGFFKSVNTHNGYVQEDITIPNNLYTYRLNYAQSDNAEVTDMVFFDVLERGAYDNAFHGGQLERATEWSGEFDSIDITPLTKLLKKGSTSSNKVYCAPVVYYSTKAKDQFTGSDWDTSNTATWTTTMPEKSQITAVAVDCTMASDGTTFEMQGRNSAMFYIRMRSSSDPADIGKVAVNQGMFKAVVNNEPNEATSDTAVTLTEEEPEIHKESDPETGTAEEPTIVVPGESLTYTLSVTNKNAEFTVPNIVVEDPIPSALLINTNNITVHFGDPENAMSLHASPRANVRVSGNNLVFTINSLDPEEICYFIIPCSVKNEADTVLINTATITSVNDVEKDIDSETTYHKIGFRVPVSKLASNGEFAVGATLQLWDTDKEPDDLIEEWVTTNEVKYILLCTGHYKLTETVTPDGYLPADDVEFELLADGTILYADTTTDNKVIMVDEAVVPIRGTKIWKHDNDQERPASITLRLMRKIESDAASSYTGVSLAISEQDNWEYDFGNQPKYDTNGNEYIYSVEEDPVTGYTTQYLSGEQDVNGLQITFNAQTSTYDSSDKFTLYYVFGDRMFGETYYGAYGEATNPAGTTIQIPSNEFWIAFESDGENNDYGFKLDQIIPVKMADYSPTHGRITPPAWVSSASIEEYTGGRYPETEHNYYIFDKLLMHYSRELAGGSYDIINIKETPSYEIPINKINEDDEKIGGVSMILTSVPEPGDPEIEPIEWTTVEGQSHIVELYPGHYLLHEVAPAAGYLVAEDIAFVVDGDGNVIIDETELDSVDMLDKYVDQPYPFRKVWLDTGLEAYRPSSVTFNLYRVSDGTLVGTKTLTSADAEDTHIWAGEFDPVPMVDVNMDPIEYVVREVVVNDDYTVYHDIQNKVGFHITFTEDTDLGTNGVLYIFPLGYPNENTPAFCQGKAKLVLNPAMNMDYAEGTDLAGKTFFVPIIEGVEGFVIFKSLKDDTLPDDTVNVEIASITPAVEMEPYRLSGNGGPSPVNIYTGSDYPNLNDNAGTYTYMWYTQPDTVENIGNTKDIDEIVNEINKVNVPFVKYWDNENGDTSSRPADVTFGVFNLLDTTTPLDIMTVPAGTSEYVEYQFENLPKYNHDNSLAQYVVREAPVQGYKTVYAPDQILGLLVTFSNDSTAGDGSMSLYPKTPDYMNGPAAVIGSNGESAISGNNMAGKTYYVPVSDPLHPGFIMTLTDDTTGTAKLDVTSVVPVDYFRNNAIITNGAPTMYVVNKFFEGSSYPYIHAPSDPAAIPEYGYTSNVAYDYVSTNMHDIHNIKDITSIPVTKTWGEDTAEDRPASLTINAYNINDLSTIVGSVTLTASNLEAGTNNWVGQIAGLPKYNADGSEAQYVIKEDAVPAGYSDIINQPKGLLITFTGDSYAGSNSAASPIQLYAVSVADNKLVKQVWPASGTAQISRNDVSGTTMFVPVADDGSFAFAIYKRNSGYTLNIESVRLTTQEKAYNFNETNIQIPANAYVYQGTDGIDLSSRTGYVVYKYNVNLPREMSLDNHITNEINNTNVPFAKVWDNENGDISARPENITFNLYDEADSETVIDTMTVPAGTVDYTEYQFENVPKYNEDGELINYIIRENAVTGYHTIVADAVRGLLVKFTDDSDAGTGSVNLYPKNGNNMGGSAYVSGTATTLTGTEMAGNTYYVPVPNQNDPGFVLSLIDPDKNSHVEVESVIPVDYYRASMSGTTYYPIEFYAGEHVVSYTGNAMPDISINSTTDGTFVYAAYDYESYMPEVHNIKNETSVPMTKIWQGDTAADRPASITINAYNTLAPDVVVGSIMLTATDADNETQWSGEITGLPKYNIDGSEAQYVLKEVPVEGYYAKYEKPTGMLVKFTEDSVVAPGSAIYLSVLSTRSRYKSHTISYPDIHTDTTGGSISGAQISGHTFYIPILDDNSYSFVVTSSNRNNIIKIESVQLTTEPQPYSLYTDVAWLAPETTNTNYSNYWYYGAGGFDMKDAGDVNCLVYVYTGAKGQANNGGASIDGVITNEKNTIDIPFVKEWDDAGYEGDRPDTITFTLYNTNDDQTPVSTVTLNRSEVEIDNTWSGAFPGVPKYNDDGTEAVYIIKENALDYYESINSLRNITGYLIKFSDDTDIAGKTLSIYQSDGVHYLNLVCPSPAATISVPHKWDYATDSIAGKTVYIPLLVPNIHAFTVELTGSGSQNPNAHYTIESITPVYEELQAAIVDYTPNYNYDQGLVQEGQYHQVTYDIEENATSYTGSLDGWDRQTLITHFLWNYDSSRDHGMINRKNRYNIEINKYSETYEKLAGATLQILKKSDNSVVYEWISNIYDYQCELGAGEFILHEVEAPEGFKAAEDIEFIVDNDGTIKVENEPVDQLRMFDAEVVDVVGEKAWVGDNASQRPESITVNLLRNGVQVDSQSVTAADQWKYTFEDLDRYDENGIEYVYTVDEEPVYDYSETEPATSLTESWHADTSGWLPPDNTSVVNASHAIGEASLYGYQIVLDASSNTESYLYDYFYVYFRMNGNLYRISSGQGSSSGKFGGSLANATITVPSNDIYLVWRSDVSVVKYGWKIVDMIPITAPITNVTYASQDSLPTTDAGYSFGTPLEYSGTNYPETAHDYAINERIIYHWVGSATYQTTVDAYEISAANGLLVKFTADSATEETNDTLEFFCKVGDDWYQLPTTLSGNIGGTEVVIPSREFYIKWNSNSSTTASGWQIETITDYGPASVTVLDTAADPVVGTPGIYIGSHYPERVNYDNDETIVYRYMALDASNATITDEQDRVGSQVTANITNTRLPDKQNYSVYKQSPDNELIAGAVLEITGHEDNTTYDIVPIRWTSSDSGPQVVQLRAGQYVLHEITPPTGYLHAADIPFIITSEGNMIVGSETVSGLYMTDIPNLLSIPVSKVWDDTGFSRYRPASITFDLYDTSDPTTVVDTLVLTAQDNWASMFENVPYVYPGTEEKIEYTVVERDVEYYDEEITTDAAVLDAGVSETSANKSFVYTPAYGMRINMSSEASTQNGPLEIIYKDLMTGKWFSTTYGTGANANLCIMATEAYLLYRSYGSSTGIDIDSVSTYAATMYNSLPSPQICSGGTIWDDEDINDVLPKAILSGFWPTTLTSADFTEGNGGYHNSCAGKDFNASPVYQLVHVVRPAYSQTVVTQVPSTQEIASAEGFHITIGDDQGLSPNGPAYIVWKATDGNYYRAGIEISGVNPLSYNIKSKEFYLFYVDGRYASGFPTDGQSTSSYSRGITVSSVSPVSGVTWLYDIPDEGVAYSSYDAAIKDGNEDYFGTYTLVDGRNGFLAQDPRVPTGIAFDYGSAVPWYSYNDYYSEHGEFVAAQVVAKNTFTAPPDFDVPFEKVNSNGTRIAGAHLKLFTSEGTLVAEWDSSASAAHTESLEPGTYVLRETGTPSGYITAADITFTVTNTGEISVGGSAVNIVSMTDETQPSVYVDKVDYSHQATSLTGAVLKLYDADDTLLHTWTTDGTPHDITQYVVPGNNYRIRESSAPAGFNVMSEDIYIQVAANGAVTITTTEWATVAGNNASGYTVKLYNNAGVFFPSTGASDRTLVYLGAVLIMLASAALLIRRKRRHTSA